MKKITTAALLGGAAATAIAATLGVAAPANAYPGELALNVCQFLDANPESSYTINRYFDIAIQAGMSGYAAGAQLDSSVTAFCPWHLGMLNYYRAQQGYPPLLPLAPVPVPPYYGGQVLA